MSYDSRGNRISTGYPNGVTVAASYDASSRLLSLSSSGSGGTISSYQYSYSAGGVDRNLRQSVVDQAGTTTTYSYDALERLCLATAMSSSNQVQSQDYYQYDATSNLQGHSTGGSQATSCAGAPAGSSTTTYGYTVANQYSTTGYANNSYDGNGNQTSQSGPGYTASLSYNAKNQLSDVATRGANWVHHAYRGSGSADLEAIGATTYGSSLLGLSSEVTNAQATTYVRDANGMLLEEVLPGGAPYFYSVDGIGSVVALTDQNGAVAATYTYDPTGRLISSTGTVANPWRFASGYTVASFDQWTSLEKFGQRYLLTGVGRWTQQDALPNAFDTHGDNRYVYAGDDPVNFSDPSGQLSCDWCREVRGHQPFRSWGAAGHFGLGVLDTLGAMTFGIVVAGAAGADIAGSGVTAGFSLAAMPAILVAGGGVVATGYLAFSDFSEAFSGD